MRHIFFIGSRQINTMKTYLTTLALFTAIGAAKAQTIDSLFLNLYTDSLKKGTFNYINADGLLSSGRYLPLDTSSITLTASAGHFEGNSLWIPADFEAKKVRVVVCVKANRTLTKTIDIPIKQLPDGPLKTREELMREMSTPRKKKN